MLDVRGQLGAVGIENADPGARRRVEAGGHEIGAPVRQRVPDDHVAPDRAGQQRQRVVPGRAPQLPRVAPAGQQVQVDLVGLRAGDGVVVCAVGQLYPRLGEGGLRVLGAGQQRGEHGEALGGQHGVLGGPVGLLGVDVGHVLAGVDRVHVAGLRRRLTTALRQFRAHRREKLPRQRAHQARPGVPRGPVAVDRGHPLVRRRVVGPDGQQHVARQGDLLEPSEQRIGGPLGLRQRGGRVHPPARPVVRGHVVGEQAATRRRDPLELAAELHAVHVAARAPLVVRAAGPRARRQARVGGKPRKLGIVAEHVELPRGGGVGAQHVTLKTVSVHHVSDGCFRSDEVGVRFVVGAAHHLDAALGEEPAQVGAVLGVGVPVRLEVVHLRQHELVFGLAAGQLQVGMDQFEGVGLAPRRVFGPLAGIGALGVPPDRVVVEVTDHEHGPPGLGDGELEFRRGATCVHPRRPALTDGRTGDRDRHLDGPGSGLGHRRTAQAVAFDADRARRDAAREADARQLQRRVRRPDEKLGRVRRNHLHPRTLRREAPRWRHLDLGSGDARPRPARHRRAPRPA